MKDQQFHKYLIVAYLYLQVAARSISPGMATVFLIGIHSMQGLTATTMHVVTRKRDTKRLNNTGNLFRKKLQIKGVC